MPKPNLGENGGAAPAAPPNELVTLVEQIASKPAEPFEFNGEKYKVMPGECLYRWSDHKSNWIRVGGDWGLTWPAPQVKQWREIYEMNMDEAKLARQRMFIATCLVALSAGRNLDIMCCGRTISSANDYP